MVKVEMKRMPERGIIALAFECSNADEHEVIDAIRTMIFGNHPRTGGYVDSNRLVIHVETPPEKLETVKG